ncbi:MAG: UDP-N-acetylmuramate dehydrogenase [Acidobacteria bacterium]|nr:UDP-N-acetylmuramate dehydrogenase [Acidobacteriota bacterium]
MPRLADPPRGVQPDIPLAPSTTLGVGGSARWFLRATSAEEVASAYAWCRDRDVAFTVIGGGSNLVVADSGIDGLVVQIAIGGIDISERGKTTVVRAGAGEVWDTVVAAATGRGAQGLECLSGIPGTVGGTPVQNVGAYGQEVADSISEVTVLDCDSGEMGSLRGSECAFGYRTSRFKAGDAGRFVVCGVTYELTDRQPTVTYPDLIRVLERQGIRAPAVADVRAAVLSIRRSKGMVVDATDPDTRSVGSFFMNPIVDASHHARMASAAGHAPGYSMADGRTKVPAAWLIERSGFSKGYGAGPAGLSSKHPLAIVNRGGATARDVVGLARHIQQQVADRFDVWLKPEPTFIGFGDDDLVRNLVRANVDSVD